MPSPTISSSNGGPKRSRLPVYSPTSTTSSSTNLKRANDELRQHIARLKSELEIEKAKSKQVHRDKVADIKRLKDEFDKEKALAAGSFSHKQKLEHEHEIKKLRESLQKEKEIEIKHIIKFKDEELKTTKKMMLEDKEFSLRQLEEKLRRELSSKNKDVNDNDFKLRQEVNEFKKQKNQLEELYKQKMASEAEKVELIRKLKEEHDRETQRVIRDARIQIARNVHELKAAQKALSEKEQEITRRELEVTKLEEEKEILSDKLRTEPRRVADQFDRSEKERELLMKNVELRKSLDEMNKKVVVLERDSSLKRSESKDAEPSSRSEQRIKELKKRNGELVTLAKKLEEKAKRLQDELKEIKSKGPVARTNSSDSPAAFDNFKKSFTLQRARDLAENAKSTIAKDKEIAQLKEKIISLEKHYSKVDESSQVAKLESTIQQMEKEKIALEKQLSNRSRESPNLRLKRTEEDKLKRELESVEKEKDKLKILLDKQKQELVESQLEIKNLQSKIKEDDNIRKDLESAEKEKNRLKSSLDEQRQENSQLEIKVERWKSKCENLDKVAAQLEERDEECLALTQDLRSSEKEIQKLKDILTDTERINKRLESEQEKSKHIAKSLQAKMADMSKKLVEMQSFELECKMLKDRLQDSETKYMMMQGQLECLQNKVDDFKHLEKDLEETVEKCSKWERDYDYAVDQINKKNKEISELAEAKQEADKSHKIEIEELQNEIRRLETACSDFERKEVDYKEMINIAKEQTKIDVPKIEVIKNDVYVQTSRPHTPVLAQRIVQKEEVVPSFEHVLESGNDFDNNAENVERFTKNDDEEAADEFGEDLSEKFDDDILDIASSRIAELAVISSSEGELSRGDEPKPRIATLNGLENIQPAAGKFEASEPDNKAVNDVVAGERQLHRQNSDTSDELTLSLDEMSDDDDFNIPFENNNRKDRPTADNVISNGLLHKPPAVKRLDYQKKNESEDSLFAPITPQASVDEFVSEKNLRNQIDSENSLRKKSDTSAFDKASKNADKLTVFIAKYTYDPYEHSPNEDPGLELSLHSGDFVYVFGDIDEDGFYTGELVNGQRGLVPSNFVERVTDDNVVFPQLANGHDGYPGDESDEDLTEVSGSVSPTDSLINLQHLQQPENDKPLDAEYLKNTRAPSFTSSNNIADALREELSSLNSETDEDNEYIGFPPPRQLTLERQLNSSVVLSWLPPEGIADSEIHGYAVKADGALRQTLIGAGRTKAIVSDIQRDKVYRMSVHTLNKEDKEFPSSVATLTIGRGASAVPSDMRIDKLTSRSAELEWTCGNSSYAHAVCLGENIVHVVKPGVDRFRLTNLDPDTEYEVTIEARKAKDIHKKPSGVVCVSDGLIFRTPEEGRPEPPLNVQVHVDKSSKQKEAALLISWLPVTITDIGTSNGSIVQGYTIYINNKEISKIDSATADHVVLPYEHLRHFLQEFASQSVKVWVTSQSSVGESTLSNIVSVNENIIMEITSLIEEGALENGGAVANGGAGAVEEILQGDGLAKESNMADETAAERFDLNRKDSDVNRKIEWINELVEEKPMEAVICTQDEKAPMMEEKEEKLQHKTEACNTENEVSNNEAVVSENEAPLHRVKGKSTVIRYDVTDSDSSDEDEDSDSDVEIQHGYKGAEDKEAGIPSEAPKTSGGEHEATDHGSAPSEESDNQSGPTETLILPTIPKPDYDDDDAEVEKPVMRINFEDLLLSDDSELSAIEEETDEELLEYNKGKDRSISPGHTFSLEDPENDTGPGPVNGPDIGTDLNKTFSLHSDDDKGDTFDIEKEPGSSGKQNVARSSKDSLTFSSDDIIDILDKDVIGGVPELPDDEDKNSGPTDDNVIAGFPTYQRQADDNIKSGLKESGADIEVSGLDIRRPDGERSDQTEIPDLKDNYIRHNETVNEHVPKDIQSSKVPAIWAPAESNDHHNVNNDVYTPGQLEVKENSGFSDKKIDIIGEPDIVKKLEDSTNKDNVEISETTGNGGRAVEPENAELGSNFRREDDRDNDARTEKSTLEINTSLTESMGQAIVPEPDYPGYDDDDDASDSGAVKMPNPSVHDLYNLHAGGSFDDSILDSEPGYEPDFTGEELRHNQTDDLKNEHDVISKKLKSLSIEEPVAENSTENLSVIAGGENNTAIDMNENSNENTRTNHVVDNSNNDNVRVFIALFSYDPITMSPNTDGIDEELTFKEGDLIRVIGDVDEDGFYFGELNDARGFVPSNMVQEVSLGNLEESINIPPPPSQEDSSIESSTDSKPGYSSLRKQSSVSTKNQNVEAKAENTQQRNQPDNNSHPGSLEAMNNTQKRDSRVNDIAADLDNIVIEEDDKSYRYISERDSIYCLPPRRMIALYDYDPAISSPNVDSEVELAFNKGEILYVFGDMDEDGFYAAQNETERGLVPSNFLEECPEPHEPEEIEINMGAESPSIKSSSRKSSSSSIGAASPVDSTKKKKKGILAKGKKIFSKLKGK